jgi:hypothetical protein
MSCPIDDLKAIAKSLSSCGGALLVSRYLPSETQYPAVFFYFVTM